MAHQADAHAAHHPSSEPPSDLERLPVELQLHVCGYLDYGSVIMLSMTNTWFRIELKAHTTTPEAGKIDFMKKAQFFKRYHDVEFLHHVSYDHAIRTHAHVGYACFGCFTIKSMDSFSTRMILRCNKWGGISRANGREHLRRCIQCQIEGGYYRHGLEIQRCKTLDLHFVPEGRGSVMVDFGHSRGRIWDYEIEEWSDSVYCADCKALHDEPEDCKATEKTQVESQKSRKRGGPWSSSIRKGSWICQPRLLRRHRELDVLVCGICLGEADTSWCCLQCKHWVCFHCIRYHGGGTAYALGGDHGPCDHRLHLSIWRKGDDQKMLRFHKKASWVERDDVLGDDSDEEAVLGILGLHV
jgi:hypothetical protein